ncbi:MAG: glycoside hydrolase family 127 protein [Planctomycetia bacterium]|nr:glycoside hydrolase family 127 protein [Planctomycetia bacterium]
MATHSTSWSMMRLPRPAKSESGGWAGRRLLLPAAWVLFLAIAAPWAFAADAMSPLDIREVKVGGEIGRRIDVTVSANLLGIDVEKSFLQPFRPRNLPDGYIGLGKLIDATVRFAAYTGDPRVLALKKQLVAEAIKTQEPDGYIGILAPPSRVWGVYDIHETSHIVLGLANDYRYFGEKASLEAARKLADFIINRWSAEPDRFPGGTGKRANMYGVTTGLDAALLTLYEQTKDPRYLDFCVHFKQYQLPKWNAAIKIGFDVMDDERHCYIYMALCVAQMQLNRIQPDPKLFDQAHRAIDFLTRQDGLLVSGSCSFHEGWHSDQCGTPDVSESCATAYLTRMLDRLLRAEGDSRYGDMMERAVYNALFAAQSPDGRQLRYFSPLDGKRVYFDRGTFCCPNNFRRIMAELPMMIYYRMGTGLAVNLYTASTAKMDLGDGLSLAVRQETDYPRGGDVLVHLDPSRPAAFPLGLRIPRWCAEASVTVNDQPIDKAVEPGKLLVIDREWKAGDRVRLRMPMEFRLVKGRKLQAGRVAVLRGPALFCLNPARNEKLAGVDLKEVTIDPTSLEGPIDDNTIRPGGQACRVRAWSPGKWSPTAAPDLALLLTEFADPGGEATFFKVPDPNAGTLIDDELIQPGGSGS